MLHLSRETGKGPLCPALMTCQVPSLSAPPALHFPGSAGDTGMICVSSQSCPYSELPTQDLPLRFMARIAVTTLDGGI